jgi:hypothetical protein
MEDNFKALRESFKNQSDKIDNIKALKDRKGIYGFGFSNNKNLDLLNLLILACSGIIIKIFFSDNTSDSGANGPASTTIWGYGLTSIALLILIFMSINLSRNINPGANNPKTFEDEDSFFKTIIKLIMTDALPIIVTFGLLIYIIYLNYTYYKIINQNKVTNSYHTYSLFSSIILILQIGLIFKYLYGLLEVTNGGKYNLYDSLLIKNISYILVTINFIFVIILHILLSYFSTDG